MDEPKTYWTMSEIDYFVLLYKNHECLWNDKNASFRDKSLRDAAFADIESKMKLKNRFITKYEIKNKINNLLTTYSSLRQKYKDSVFSPSRHAGKWYKDIDFIAKNSDMLSKLGSRNSNPKLLTNAEPEATESTVTDYDSEQEGADDGTIKTISTHSVKLKSRISVMNVLKKLYMKNVSPNYFIMYDILKAVIQSDDANLTNNLEGFKKEMTELGYIYKETIDGSNIIIENAKQRFERYLYLDKILKVRARSKPIVYIDQRVINTHLKYERFEGTLQSDSSIFFHAISKHGILSGLFSNSASEADFSKWVTDILLYQLKIPSVIVMDNNPIHGAIIDSEKFVTRYSTKKEMLKWLVSNNIPCSVNTSRPQLYELIRMKRNKTKEYRIDAIIQSHGHEVLRIPDSFPEFNMTHGLWAAISKSISDMLKSKTVLLTSLQVLQSTILDVILPSMNKIKWHELERTVILNENEIHSIDVAMETILENYEFM